MEDKLTLEQIDSAIEEVQLSIERETDRDVLKELKLSRNMLLNAKVQMFAELNKRDIEMSKIVEESRLRKRELEIEEEKVKVQKKDSWFKVAIAAVGGAITVWMYNEGQKAQDRHRQEDFYFEQNGNILTSPTAKASRAEDQRNLNGLSTLVKRIF